MESKISFYDFYSEYHGHKIEHLNQLKQISSGKSRIYLAGDSSLDNKYWLPKITYPAVNGYQHILDPPEMKPDISYHMNKLLEDSKYFVVNTSVEASTIRHRSKELLDQDKHIKENITSEDILIVSVGGNDIALAPNILTLGNMASMMYMNTVDMINEGPSVAWGMNYFISLFKDSVREYILDIIGEVKPKKIIVCTIYYPDEKQTQSWSNAALNCLGYNTNPEKLQAAIRQTFIHATSNIKIEGCQVIPFPMFEVLDGKDSSLYIQRVEPSVNGGLKLAEEFVKYCI